MRTLCATPDSVSRGRDILVLSSACFMALSGVARAQEPTATPVIEEAPKSAPAKAPPYSLPWQLRPVAPGNVVRLDFSYGFYEKPVEPHARLGARVDSTR